MAISQISKIQVRSGNIDDLPQLSVGEFGWAADERRLFIGNDSGNIVGVLPDNTEILTTLSPIPGTGTVTSVSGNGNALGFALGGTVTNSGNITLTGPNANSLRTTLSIGNVANANFNGNGQTFLAGNGSFANIAIPTVGNIATLNLNGNGQTFLAGNGSFIATSGFGTVTNVSGNGSALGFALGGTVTAAGNITLTGPNADSLRTTLNIGNVANTNYNGNGNTFLAGNGVWSNILAPAVDNLQNTLTAGNTANVGISLTGSAVYTGNGSGLSTIAGANVTGFVPNANVANTALSVAVANVTGIGNIATTNYNGNGNTFLAGNGTFIATSGFGTVTNVSGNGSVLGFALGGTVTTSGNITLTGPNADSLRTTLNVGNVANANFNGNGQTFLAGNGSFANIAIPSVGNIATLNLNGNGQTFLAGNGSFIVPNGFGTVTSVSGNGNALGFSLSGTVTAAGNITLDGPDAANLRAILNIGNVANANFSGQGLQYLAGNGVFANLPAGNGISSRPAVFEYTISGTPATSSNIAADEILEFAFSSDYNGTSKMPLLTTRSLPVASSSFGAATNGSTIVLTNGTDSSGGTLAYTSTDNGNTWTQRTLPSTGSWQAVAYGAGLFVAISLFSSNVTIYSNDGITWTIGSIVDSAFWRSLTFDNGIFVAVADDAVSTSPDGINWTSRSISTSFTWGGAVYGNGIWLLISSVRLYISSDNGVSWSDTGFRAPLGQFRNIAFGGGQFIVNTSLPTVAYTSTDGNNWTQRAYPSNASWTISGPMTYYNGTWVTFQGGAGGVYGISTDGYNLQYVSKSDFNPSQLCNVANNRIIITLGGGRASIETLDLRASAYSITLPAHDSYSQQTITFTSGIDANSTPTTQASSLGNQITTLRNTYTATYPSAGRVDIDTNSQSNIGDTILATTAQVPLTGNLTLGIVQGGNGELDRITFTDPQNSQTFEYLPALDSTRANIGYTIADQENLSNYFFTFKTTTASTTKILAERIPAGNVDLANIPTVTVVTGSRSNLAIASTTITLGS